MATYLKSALGISLILQVTISIPFPCSVYDASLTITQTDVVLDIDYAYGNGIIAVSTGNVVDSNLRSIDALTTLCTCSSLHVSNVTLAPRQITTLRIIRQQINMSHLSSRPFGCLTGLRTVDLSGNSFPSGIDDSVFSAQSALANLYLDNCRISTFSSSAFSNLQSLRTLSLRSNWFQTLPTDFLSNSQVSSLVLDDNLLLQSIPKKLVMSNPSLKLSAFRTPSLSCVPSEGNVIPVNSLANCSEIVSSDKVYSGKSLLTQKISVQFSSIWDDDSPSTYLANFLGDISLALALDSSRIINPEIFTDSGRTTVLFNVLPRTREGQLAAESVANRIAMQLHLSRQFSMLKQGIVTQWLTSISKVASQSEELAYCIRLAVFTDAISCNNFNDNGNILQWTSPVILGATASLSAVIVIIVMLVLIKTIRMKQVKKHPAVNIPIPPVEPSGPKRELNQIRAVSAVAYPMPDLQHPQSAQARAQSVTPVLQYQDPSTSKMDNTNDINQQRSASVNKAKQSKKTKKWDADRLANPWIAKEEDQSDDGNEFW